MRTFKHSLYGVMIRVDDINVGDVVMCRRHINSKSAPFWPFRITDTTPEKNAHGFPRMPGQWLLPGGDSAPGNYSAVAIVREHEGELYFVAKPMEKNWAKNNLKKVQTEIDELTSKKEWLETLIN